MFGEDDAFLTVILKLLRRLPAYPIFGQGETRLQPAYVEDVAEGIARAIQRSEQEPITIEFGGPRVYAYEALLKGVAREAGLKPVLFPVPFAVWHGLARVARILPRPPITRNQIELMQIDTVASPKLPGFIELGISPQTVELIVRSILSSV
jgi:NADH dehydrogenase